MHLQKTSLKKMGQLRNGFQVSPRTVFGGTTDDMLLDVDALSQSECLNPTTNRPNYMVTNELAKYTYIGPHKNI